MASSMENSRVAELANAKGDVAFEDKDYATARSLYSHAVTFDQSNHLYPLNRSMTNLKLARWDEAEADATKTLELSPGNSKALFRRGVARKELRKWDQARIDIEMSIANGGDAATLGAQELKAIADLEKPPPSEPSSYASSELDSGLANLHLQDDDSSSFTTHASAAVQGGQGAFATRDIQRGDLILSESPIFRIPTPCPEPTLMAAVENLSPVDLDHFLSLQNSHIDCSCRLSSPISGIFCTNAFPCDQDVSDAGICLRAARLNHSCSPNAAISFNPNTGQLRIYALGNIPLGEEIFVAYVHRKDAYGSPRQSRQATLCDLFHFTCACSVCSLPEAESKMSDSRRVKLDELREIILNFNPMQGNQRLNVIVEAIRLLKEEGYLGAADDFTITAALACSFHSDWVSAKYWAGLTYYTRVAEFGEDHPEAAELREMYLNPRSFDLAGRGPPMSLAAIRI